MRVLTAPAARSSSAPRSSPKALTSRRSWRGSSRTAGNPRRRFLRVPGAALSWTEYRVEATEYRELDDERVLVLDHLSGRGKTSGLELGQLGSKGASVFHVRDGKVTWLASYADRKRALADLDLGPETDSP